MHKYPKCLGVSTVIHQLAVDKDKRLPISMGSEESLDQRKRRTVRDFLSLRATEILFRFLGTNFLMAELEN
jgi:hypothetical protein